jgi:hypothetical protein
VSVSQDQHPSAKLPGSIKSAGVIKDGTDATYAPKEFLAGAGKTVQGMDRVESPSLGLVHVAVLDCDSAWVR